MNEMSSFKACLEQKELIEGLVDQGFIDPVLGKQMIKRVFDRHFKWVKEYYGE